MTIVLKIKINKILNYKKYSVKIQMMTFYCGKKKRKIIEIEEVTPLLKPFSY